MIDREVCLRGTWEVSRNCGGGLTNHEARGGGSDGWWHASIDGYLSSNLCI